MRLGMMYLKGKDYEDYGVIAPLAFGYLAAYLEQYLQFKDIILEVDNRDLLLQQSPDVIGLSSFTETFEDAIGHARAIKQMSPHTPIILGGEHISAIPGSLPPEIDVGVIGEGEETLAELIQLYQRNEATPDNLRNVKGIIFWDKGQQVITAPREWIEDMDSIPMPNRELLLKDTKWRQPIFTARGCPYKCTFCASTQFWQRTRYHSVERVTQEIEYIISHFPEQNNIPINDDLFPLNKKRMRAVVEGIRAKGLHKKVGFTLNARASVFDEEIAQMILDMNGQVVCFGLESASDRILDALKGKTSARDNQRVMEICERYNLPVVSNMMVGTPDEEVEDLAKSWWFIQKNYYRFARPAIAYSTPFPGTEFWNEAQRQGLVDEGFQRWNVLDLGYRRGTSLYMNKHLEQAEFENIYNHFRKFQVPLKDGYKEIYAWMTKRKYFDALYERLLEVTPLSGPLLEIGFEQHSIGDHVTDLDWTKVFLEGDQVDLTPIAGQQYQTILLSHVLEKVRQPVELLKALHAHLRPGGQLLCMVYNSFHPHVLEMLLTGKWVATPFGINHHRALRFFTADSLKRLLRASQWQAGELETLMDGNHQFSAAAQQAMSLLAEEYDLPAANAAVSFLLRAEAKTEGMTETLELAQLSAS